MLDAGALSLIVRAGAGVNTIDVAAASRRGIYVSNCPGKNAIAVAELDVRVDPRARPPHSRQRRRPARRYVEQEGILEGDGADTDGRLAFSASGSIGQEVARRARAFGMPVVVWSRRFDATMARRRRASRRSRHHSRRVAGRASPNAPTSSACTSRWRTRRADFVGASILNRLTPGSYLVNTVARRDRGPRGAGRGGARRAASASGSMSLRRSRRPPRASSPIR